MGGVFLNLDECLGFLEQNDVALGCVFHFNVTETMLLPKEREEGGWRAFSCRGLLKTLPPLPLPSDLAAAPHTALPWGEVNA